MPDLYKTEKVPMTPADRERLNVEHVTAQLELERMKDEKRSVNRVYRVGINKLEEQISSLAKELDEGAFERKFEVLEVPDDNRMLVSILRAETKELVDTRPMNEVEKEAARGRKQGDLPFEGDGDTEPPPPRMPRAKAGRGKKPGRR
jgi:hypothetical protein